MGRSPESLRQAWIDWRRKRDAGVDREFWDEFARLLGRALKAQKKCRAELARAQEAAEQERLAWWC